MRLVLFFLPVGWQDDMREFQKLEKLFKYVCVFTYRIVTLLLIRVSSTIFRVPMRFLHEKFFFSWRIQLRWFQYNVTYKFPNFEILDLDPKLVHNSVFSSNSRHFVDSNPPFDNDSGPNHPWSLPRSFLKKTDGKEVS